MSLDLFTKDNEEIIVATPSELYRETCYRDKTQIEIDTEVGVGGRLLFIN